MKRTLPAAAALLLLFTACESGTGENYTLVVAEGVAEGYGEDAPGLLRTGSGGAPAVRVLCGQAIDGPIEYYVDHGFGCLEDEREGTTEARTAWVEPAPEAWDVAALCALGDPDPGWSGVWIGSEVTGHEAPAFDDLAEAPEEGWPQGTGTGTWKRDFSPCGGSLRVEVRIE